MRQQRETDFGTLVQPAWGRADLQPKDPEPEEDFEAVAPEDQYPEVEFDPRMLNPGGIR